MRYIIDEGDLRDLLIATKTLDALFHGGVDDWEWFENSLDEFQELHGNIEEVDEDLKEFEVYE